MAKRGSEFEGEIEESGVFDNPALQLSARDRLRLAIRTGQMRSAKVKPSQAALEGRNERTRRRGR